MASSGRDRAGIAGVESSHSCEVEPPLRLTDTNYRKSVVAGVTNPAVQSFWLTEFDRWQERDRTLYLACLQNKLGAFTKNERLQAILGATETDDGPRSFRSITINPRRYYDRQDKEWRDAGSYNPADLPALIFALQKPRSTSMRHRSPARTAKAFTSRFRTV